MAGAPSLGILVCIDELKHQVTDIVHDVMSDPTNRRITITPEEEAKKTKKGQKEK